MTTRIYVDRSRYETGQRCLRSRYLEYHFGGMGITSAKKPLPLAVGGSVHAGLAELLRRGQAYLNLNENLPKEWEIIEDAAVAAALHDFAQYSKRLELPDQEQAATASPAPESLTAQLQDSLGQDSAATRAEDSRDARSAMDEYLFAEQSALVEAMVRAYARRRLRPLLEQFEVLEVEREGEWKLGEIPWLLTDNPDDPDPVREPVERELWFMSRPDALLRERESNQLYLLSYKTAASWDIRKARDAEHDMQGMSEGIEVERRLAEWWHELRRPEGERECSIEPRIAQFLRDLDAPPRILAVRYEYMLKSERWLDKDLSARYGVEMRSQRSPLIRQYVAVSVPQRGTAGYSIGDVNCSWEYVQDDGRESKLAYQNWKSRPVWDQLGGVRAWIDKLDDMAPAMSGEDSTIGMEPRQLGYKSDAQVSGYLKEHPLDAVFVPPIIVYRQEDELRDMVEQMEAVERRIAEGVAAVDAASDAGEVRHLLNLHFSQTRRACSYPTQCQYVPICFGGEEIRSNPLGSGLFTIRQPNHPQEKDANEV